MGKSWRKSTRSNVNGACVEVRRRASTVQVRDTKDRRGPVLTFSTDAWRAFVAGVHAGRFDRP
jgi:hypothetical protein